MLELDSIFESYRYIVYINIPLACCRQHTHYNLFPSKFQEIRTYVFEWNSRFAHVPVNVRYREWVSMKTIITLVLYKVSVSERGRCAATLVGACALDKGGSRRGAGVVIGGTLVVSASLGQPSVVAVGRPRSVSSARVVVIVQQSSRSLRYLRKQEPVAVRLENRKIVICYGVCNCSAKKRQWKYQCW